MHLSVIICTNNPREDYLRRTLDALQQQTLPRDQWELLLIDNASEEPLAGQWDLSWHPNGRHVREDELGLTPARLRGIQESSGELLVFVDDDNVLQGEYLEICIGIAHDQPHLGCFGAGLLEPEFETTPAEELLPFTEMLALRSVARASWSNVAEDCWVPWGAGLGVRRSVAEQHKSVLQSSRLGMLLDRKGDALNSCGDNQISWTACTMGYGRGVFPELRVLHLIDRRREQRAYLLKLAQGHAYSHAILNAIHGLPTDPTENEPNIWQVIQAAASLSVSRFFYEGQRWWGWRSKPLVEKEFERARCAGVQQALELLKQETDE